MADAPGLGRREVRPGPGEPPARRDLGRLGVLGGSVTVTVAAPARPAHRIARRRLAVERQVEDLAERLARRPAPGVNRCRSPELRNSDCPSGAKAIDRAELAALAAGRVAPEDA